MVHRHQVRVVADVHAGPGGQLTFLDPVADSADGVGAGSGFDPLSGPLGRPVGVLLFVPLGPAAAEVVPSGAEAGGNGLLGDRGRRAVHVQFDAPLAVVGQVGQLLPELVVPMVDHRAHAVVVAIYGREPQREDGGAGHECLDDAVVGSGKVLEPGEVLQMSAQCRLVVVRLGYGADHGDHRAGGGGVDCMHGDPATPVSPVSVCDRAGVWRAMAYT